MTPRMSRCLDVLRAFYEKHGRTPTASECGAGVNPRKHPDAPHYATLARTYGSFRQAIELAGFTPRPHGLRLNRELTMTTQLSRTGGPLKSADLRPPAAETLRCTRNRQHSVRMVFATVGGIRTGVMVAWCYDCARVIPPDEKAPVVITAAERQEAPGARRSRAHDTPVTETEDTRKRNAALRLEWARQRTTKAELARRYGLSFQRVCVILEGKLPRTRRSA